MEIARSLRNSFRVSVILVGIGGRATEFERGPTRLPFETKLRIPVDSNGSYTVGDKLHSREGNNPDRLLRSLKHAQCERKLES